MSSPSCFYALQYNRYALIARMSEDCPVDLVYEPITAEDFRCGLIDIAYYLDLNMPNESDAQLLEDRLVERLCIDRDDFNIGTVTLLLRYF